MIQVGQVLDKYELLERVGQGGMAVVYRGLDRSLKRVVAVKILHKHLSDYQEARDRFEREAQAVAKLRHENILEIFDYSGSKEAEDAGGSYIVTEFIDGQTLKQAITDRPITFPEIGAMVVLQVCRALAHAHSLKILHRDVKPENIMIRSDGVVKLMDFGISHMVDLERLTVTGQLLGSPAYMAPEHVEGRPIDFRTDVFAVGIVLYQLTTGKLPFEGKNPHEVLKRIAECKFTDPRQVNPRIGNRLGRIILRAMAADPDDRYPAIGEMVVALEGYLEESGLAPTKVVAELHRYFQAPASYETALVERLVDALARRGQQLLAEDNRAGALDAFDRVLTIDKDNAKVLALLDGINRRQRYRTWATGAALAVAIGGGAVLVHRRSQPPRPEPIVVGGGEPVAIAPLPWSETTRDEAFVPPVELVDAGAGVVAVPERFGLDAAVIDPRPGPDAATDAVAQPLQIQVSPAKHARVKVGDGASWIPVGDDGTVDVTIDRELTVYVENPCCISDLRVVKPGQADVQFNLQLRPGAVIATCDLPDTTVKIDKKLARLGEKRNIFFPGTFEERTIEVEFVTKDAVIARPTKVMSGKTVEVKCEP